MAGIAWGYLLIEGIERDNLRLFPDGFVRA